MQRIYELTLLMNYLDINETHEMIIISPDQMN